MKRYKKTKKNQSEQNFVKTTILDFVEYYNKNVPSSFPRASFESLEKFRATHASLFDGANEEWTIDKHRKKVMDWLSSQT